MKDRPLGLLDLVRKLIAPLEKSTPSSSVLVAEHEYLYEDCSFQHWSVLSETDSILGLSLEKGLMR